MMNTPLNWEFSCLIAEQRDSMKAKIDTQPPQVYTNLIGNSIFGRKASYIRGSCRNSSISRTVCFRSVVLLRRIPKEVTVR